MNNGNIRNEAEGWGFPLVHNFIFLQREYPSITIVNFINDIKADIKPLPSSDPLEEIHKKALFESFDLAMEVIMSSEQKTKAVELVKIFHPALVKLAFAGDRSNAVRWGYFWYHYIISLVGTYESHKHNHDYDKREFWSVEEWNPLCLKRVVVNMNLELHELEMTSFFDHPLAGTLEIAAEGLDFADSMESAFRCVTMLAPLIGHI